MGKICMGEIEGETTCLGEIGETPCLALGDGKQTSSKCLSLVTL